MIHSFILQSGIILLLLSFFLPLLLLKIKKPSFRKCYLIIIMIACSLFLISSFMVLTGETITFGVLISGLQFSMFIDHLAAFFIIIISIVGLSVAIYSISYVEHFENDKKKNFLISFMALFITSMVLVTISYNLIGFLFFWELMSVSSFLLVMFDYEKEDTRKAGIFYFVMTQLSTTFLIFAFILIYNQTGSFEFDKMMGLSPLITSLLFVSLAIGFGIKAGVIPFHKWLPYAHPASPSSISALMSGVMIKIAIYGFVRFILLLPEQKLWWGLLILIFGTISALLGVIYALKEHDLKRLLAYHSIENIGIILIGIGLYMIFLNYGYQEIALIALFGGLFHTLNHALFKSLLFLSAGSVVNATHTKNIEEMGGLIKKMPFTATLFLIGALSISALPPFNGFVSELIIFQVFFRSSIIGSPIINLILLVSMSLFALTSALAAACFVKAFGIVFLAVPRSKEAEQAKEVSIPMLIGPAILAILCIILGIFSFQIFNYLGERANISFDLPNMLLISLAAGVLGVIIYITVKIISNKNNRVSETWGCGVNSQNSKMEYTASGFSEPIVTIFSSIYRTEKNNKRLFYDPNNIIFKEGFAEISLIKFFERYMYIPLINGIHSISSMIYKLQNKVELDSYILYSFLAILILLIYLGVVIK